MPAKSEAQRRYLNAHFGHAWVKEHHFDNHGKLPEHVGGSNMKAHHTGNTRHGKMVAIATGTHKKDPHASSAHHAKNKEHGMPLGLTNHGYKGETMKQEGGAGMEGNVEYC